MTGTKSQGFGTYVENVLLGVKSDDVTSALTKVLDRKGMRWVPGANVGDDVESIVTRWSEEAPTVVLIDCFYGPHDEIRLRELAALGLYDLREKLSQPDDLPLSLQLVKRIARGPSGAHPLIVLIADNAPLPLTQEILRLGADWVWPQRRDFEQLPELIEDIRWLSSGASAQHPERSKVLIVDNSKEDAVNLRSLLEGDFDIAIVGEKLAPKDLVDLDPRVAVESFRTCLNDQRYTAVVVDLALTSSAEKRAAELFADDSETLKTITQMKQNNEIATLSDVLGGVYVVRHILALDPSVIVCVLSNYLASTHVLAAVMRMCLADNEGASVTFFQKTDQGHVQLRDWLLQPTKC